jgi:hypothetical protein
MFARANSFVCLGDGGGLTRRTFAFRSMMDANERRSAAPATKGDLLDLKEEVNGNLGNLKDELLEAIRDNQTEILKGFFGFIQTVQARFQEQDQTEASIKRRMTTLESRVLEIEKPLNMPPNAA